MTKGTKNEKPSVHVGLIDSTLDHCWRLMLKGKGVTIHRIFNRRIRPDFPREGEKRTNNNRTRSTPG